MTTARNAAILLFAVVLAPRGASADPLVVVHQGYVLGGNDAPMDGPLPMRFRLYDAPTDGNLLWTGDAAGAPCSVAVQAGYYSVSLGAAGDGGCGSGLSTSAFADDSPRHLAVEIGGVTLAPRVSLAPLPRAAVAGNSLRLGGELPGYYLDAAHLTGVASAAILPLATTTSPGAISSAEKALITAVGALPACTGGSKKVSFDGSAWTCVDETDPRVGALTAGRWCRTDGSQVVCDQLVPVATESDPTVAGALTTLLGTANTFTASQTATSSGNVLWRAQRTGATASDVYVSAENGAAGVGTTQNVPLSFRTQDMTRGYVAGDGGLVWGAPSAGSKGAGSLNVQSLWVNGVDVGTAVSGAASPTTSASFSYNAGGNTTLGVTVGAWTAVPLNTTGPSSIAGSSRSTNTVTLPAGKYLYRAQVFMDSTVTNANDVKGVVRLRNTSDGSSVGARTYHLGARTGASVSIDGSFETTAAKNFELQYYDQGNGYTQIGISTLSTETVSLASLLFIKVG